MADIFKKEKRSQIMASISAKETTPEILIRSILFVNGFRFRKNVKKLPGCPDIVLPRYNTIIFVHGCFWHGHHCAKGVRPTSNTHFWNSKLDKNITRDKLVKTSLRKEGWRVITIWGCEIDNKLKFDKRMNRVIQALKNG